MSRLALLLLLAACAPPARGPHPDAGQETLCVAARVPAYGDLRVYVQDGYRGQVPDGGMRCWTLYGPPPVVVRVVSTQGGAWGPLQARAVTILTGEHCSLWTVRDALGSRADVVPCSMRGRVSLEEKLRTYVPNRGTRDERAWIPGLCAWLAPADFPYRPLRLVAWCGKRL